MKLSVNILLYVFLVACALVAIPVCAMDTDDDTCTIVENANDDWYDIYTIDDLSKIGREWPLDGKYHLCADLDFKNGDKINSNGEKVDITDAEHPFKGEFDGQSHTISNINIISDVKFIGGLFNYIKKAQIHDLNIENIQVHDLKSHCIGGVIGKSDNGSKITNITCSASIWNINDNSNINIGGIVGLMPSGCIENSIANCNIYGTINTTKTTIYIGGIAGTCMADMKNCITLGAINVTTNNQAYIGGILGSDSTRGGNIYDSYSLLKEINGVGYIGRILGSSYYRTTLTLNNVYYWDQMIGTFTDLFCSGKSITKEQLIQDGVFNSIPVNWLKEYLN